MEGKREVLWQEEKIYRGCSLTWNFEIAGICVQSQETIDKMVQEMVQFQEDRRPPVL